MGPDDGVRGWGPELRAEVRRSGGGGRSKWLRDNGNDAWVNPTQAVNAQRNFGRNIRGNRVNSTQSNADNGNNKGGPPMEVWTDKRTKEKVIPRLCFLLLRYSKILKVFFQFPIKSTHFTATNEEPTEMEKGRIDEPMIIEVDRKRQRNNESGPSALSNSTYDGATNNMHDVTQMHGTTTVTDEQCDPNFLKAGPGLELRGLGQPECSSIHS